MQKCYIITAFLESHLSRIVAISQDDYVLCADGGYAFAQAAGIIPHAVIGDLDSLPVDFPRNPKIEWISFPTEKDESDTFLCVREAVRRGFGEIVIVGGLGGRLDHTMANLQTLSYFSPFVKNIAIIDEKNFATVLENDTLKLQKKDGWKVSIFALSDVCRGVTSSGLCYPLNDTELCNSYPLGLSNEFMEEEATLKVREGKLLVILSNSPLPVDSNV